MLRIVAVVLRIAVLEIDSNHVYEGAECHHQAASDTHPELAGAVEGESEVIVLGDGCEVRRTVFMRAAPCAHGQGADGFERMTTVACRFQCRFGVCWVDCSVDAWFNLHSQCAAVERESSCCGGGPSLCL